MARDLSRLLSEVWGELGFWLLIISITIALSGTILSYANRRLPEQ